MSGSLTIVATPIGNLDDLSERARKALERADVVACEDTRRTGSLLSHLGIRKRMISLHEHNERDRMPALVDQIESGSSVALVSDAGTPLLSDPGFVLVRECAARGLRVEAVPGPSAVLAALVVSGLPPYPFTFAGFAPPKSGKRRRFFERFGQMGHTLVFFESPHRLAASLEDALEIFGDRQVAVVRELTKLHEEVVRGSLADIVETTKERRARGEYVIVVAAE